MATKREMLIRSKAAQIRAAERTRAELPQQLWDAQREGASIAQLMEWTGYSRRTIFYLLKESK